MRVTSRLALIFAAGSCLAAAIPAQAGINELRLAYTNRYQQTGPTTLAPLDSFFSADAFVGSLADFTGGTVTDPNAVTHPLTATAVPGFPSYSYQTPSLGFGQADTDYPDGAYSFALTGPAASGTVTKSGTAYTADLPALTAASYLDLVNIRAGHAHSFDFGGFTSGGTSGFTFFTIYDYTAGAFAFDAGLLASSTTSVTAPGSVFIGGHRYAGELIYSSRTRGVDATGNGTELDFDLRGLTPFDVPVSIPEAPSALLALGGFGFALLVRRRRA